MNPKTKKLIFTALGAGTLTLCLRLLLYRVGFDEKNILSSSHPLHLTCLAITAFIALFLFFSIRKQDGCDNIKADFSDDPFCRCCMVAAGCLMAFRSIGLTRETDTLLALFRAGLSLAAVFSMVVCALAPAKLRTLHSLCRGIITTFFALDMLCRYRGWSGNPQLPDYVFQIFACVLLSLCSYHRLAFDVGLGKRRVLLWCSLMALYLSLTCVSGPETRIFYLGGAFWAVSCVCAAELPQENSKEETP